MNAGGLNGMEITTVGNIAKDFQGYGNVGYNSINSYMPLEIAAVDDIRFVTSGQNRININSSGNLGIGTTSPTAYLNIKAGSATAGTAPLKFTAGTNLGTTEAGAVEFDGAHLYFTATNGGTRYQLDQQSAGSLTLTTTGSSGAATLVGSTLNIPQYTAGTGLSSTADFNTLGGTSAGLNLVAGAKWNTFLGYEAGKGGVVSNTVNYNTAVGFDSLAAITSGSLNSSLGSNSLLSNTSGSLNTAVGSDSLRLNTTGTDNTGVGYQSLNNNTTGSGNTSIGRSSLGSNTTGASNFAGGWSSLSFNTIGSYNVSLGYQALEYNNAGSRITAVGYNAMFYANNSTTAFDSYNVAVGYEALKGSTISTNNTGNYNSVLGSQSLFSNSSGFNSTAVGWQALYSNTTGGNNVALGSNSLNSNTSGGYNTSLGVEALFENLTTSNNTAVGWRAGRYYSSTPVANQASSNSVYLGYDTRALSASDTNEIVIGASTVGNGSNTTTIGTGNVLYVGGASVVGKVARFTSSTGYCDISPLTTSLSCSSDINLKKNITTLEDNKEFALQTVPDLTGKSTLEKISYLTPVQYNWRNNENDGDPKHIGFIAQEMEQIFPDLVSTDPKTGLKSISYASITPYLAKGIQEMNLQIKDLQSLDTTKPITLGSLIKNFLADIGNGLERIFVREVDTKNLCVSDDTGSKTCLSKVQLDELLAKAGGSPNNQNNLNIPQVNSPALTADQQLEKVKSDIEALKEGDYTVASWGLFVKAKELAVALAETNDTEKMLKITALNDTIKVLVPKEKTITPITPSTPSIPTTPLPPLSTTTPATTVGAVPVDLSAYKEVLNKVVATAYTNESWKVYQTVVASNLMTDKNTQSEIDKAVSDILAAQGSLVKKELTP